MSCRSFVLPCLAPVAFFGVIAASAQDIALIPFGSTWKYRDDGTNQGTAWRASGFNDAAWANGPAELGYGDGDEATVVSYGPSSSAKYITTYFRKTITIADVSAFAGFAMRIKRDDGIVVYLNGAEMLRQNFDEGTIGYTTLAYQAVSTAEEFRILEHILTPAQFTNGANTIAVEIHQNVANSSDISFDLELKGLDASPEVHRGPYLQAATPTGITVCWWTDVPSASRVRFGTSPGSTSMVQQDATPTLRHEVTLSGLQPNSTYYYSVGTTSTDLAGGDATHFFKTSPVPGSEQPLRVWVIGDAGTGYIEQANVRDAYLNRIANSPMADAWLWLGDNTYSHGRMVEYQMNVFRDMYEGIFRNTTLWPAPGNHDYYSGANGITNTGPYFDLFAPPTNGQSGGVASNTEAYYSFDVGNVHFISLDSYGVSRSATGPMALWLQADMAYAKANAKWTIVYWHHAPYTKGGHNSDDAGNSTEMRSIMMPILEQNGVDLVLAGHSHTYERSYLIDGHYGVSTTFNSATMGVDMTSGRIGAPHAYAKPADPTAHAGTVYAVCGSSGKKEGGLLNHPVMYMSTGSHCGSMILDIKSDSLHAEFLNETGVVVDYFDIVKPASHVKLALKVMLEGAFDPPSAMMHDSLRARGLVPLAEPYSALFTHVGNGGGESMQPSVLATTGPSAVVDWVFLQLRSKTDPTVVVSTRSALLLRNGSVVDMDGIAPVRFRVPVGDYFVSVRHRNHLGAMTNAPSHLNYVPLQLDFTQTATTTWGTDARRNINGTMALWTGDVLRDGTVRYAGQNNDRDPILAGDRWLGTNADREWLLAVGYRARWYHALCGPEQRPRSHSSDRRRKHSH
ncbi:MAG: metallophosphoesterase family protein [Flavobacteriales bacterium]|nr:metallophosphoesterase family protein [Flavobacteriales bacterium]